MSKHKKELEKKMLPKEMADYIFKMGFTHTQLDFVRGLLDVIKIEKEKNQNIEQDANQKLFIQFLKLWTKETVAFEEMENLGKKFGVDVKYHKPSVTKGRWEVKE